MAYQKSIVLPGVAFTTAYPAASARKTGSVATQAAIPGRRLIRRSLKLVPRRPTATIPSVRAESTGGPAPIAWRANEST